MALSATRRDISAGIRDVSKSFRALKITRCHRSLLTLLAVPRTCACDRRQQRSSWSSRVACSNCLSCTSDRREDRAVSYSHLRSNCLKSEEKPSFVFPMLTSSKSKFPLSMQFAHSTRAEACRRSRRSVSNSTGELRFNGVDAFLIGVVAIKVRSASLAVETLKKLLKRSM